MVLIVQKKPSKLDLLECYGILHGLVDAFPINSYLEIGVREGASLICALAKEKAVAEFALLCLADGQNQLTKEIINRVANGFTTRNKDLQIYLFDNWTYLGNEGAHERVRDLLEHGFKTRNFNIYDGDSKVTVPKFFESHTDKIDLAFIDGDHTWEGATADLENVWSHSKIIVFHDLFHPQYPLLETLFINFAKAHNLPYVILGRGVLGTGVAFNIW